MLASSAQEVSIQSELICYLAGGNSVAIWQNPSFYGW